VPGIRYPSMINGLPVVTAPAEIDVAIAEKLRLVLLEAAANGHATIVVDLTGTLFCDSSALDVLAAAHRQALDEGGELRLVLPANGPVLRALAITALDRRIPCFAGLDQALAAPRPSRPRQPGRPAERAQPVVHGMFEAADVRDCEQCGTGFEPLREHARFCSALCRVTWNRTHAGGQFTGDTPLDWSASAMTDTTRRLRDAGAMNLPEALAVISEAVWWVTLVDATMVRYHPSAYDRALAIQDPGERKVTEGTFAGLRFVRNWMGYHVDPADFIQPEQDTITGDAPVAAWRWRQVPAPAVTSLPPRGNSWEDIRYLNYRVYLAGRTVGETITRATAFLTQLVRA